MTKQSKTAILIGATGLVGEALLQKLVESDEYRQIKLFTRRASPISHPKIQVHLCDLLNLSALNDLFTGDEVFCCIGTTKAKTPDKSNYQAIDLNVPKVAAKLAKANNIDFFAVISAMGANPKSSVFYNRVKGKMEQAIMAEKLKHTYILRPSLLFGQRKETRLAEDASNRMLAIMRPLMIGKLKSYRAISASSVACCLYQLAQTRPDTCIVKSDEIQNISDDSMI